MSVAAASWSSADVASGLWEAQPHLARPPVLAPRPGGVFNFYVS
jgi:hypothetical protein